jgi:DNA-binding XRE family transcriptional regulator
MLAYFPRIACRTRRATIGSGRSSPYDNPGLTRQRGVVILSSVPKRFESPGHAELFDELKRVRAAAIEHARAAQELARERRRLIDALLAEGLSQADLARELGVTRQAIQKMVAVGQDKPRR